MTREEAIEYWEQFNAEIDDLYDTCSDADRDTLVKQREAVEFTISFLRAQQQPNAPLTLDELRSAYKFGCPVWLVGMEDGDGWVFIHNVDSCSVRYARIGTSEEWCFRTKSYGVRVWAYRQKPEGDDHDERKENENV